MKSIKSLLFATTSICIFLGCAQKREAYMYDDGAMEGRRGAFCLNRHYREKSKEEFVCNDLTFIDFLVATDGRYKKHEDELAIAELIIDRVANPLTKHYSSFGSKLTFSGPMGTFSPNSKYEAPSEKLLRIEVHLFSGEFFDESKGKYCKNYFLLMLSNNLYLRKPSQICSDEKVSRGDIAVQVVDQISSLLEEDLYGFSSANNLGDK